MSTDKPLVNRVAESSLITIKLEDYYPKAEMVNFDLKKYLFKELLLREKDFREAMADHDWEQYQDKIILVHCSSDAIIPVWAYMLVASHAAPYAKEVFQGYKETYLQAAFSEAIRKLDASKYGGKRIVIKGCSDLPVPPSAYAQLTFKLRPFAKSIMYGEPCSTVPIFKQPRDWKK